MLNCAAHAGDEDTSTPPADTTTSDADTRLERVFRTGGAAVDRRQSSATLNWLAGLIRGHLKKIGSRWRALPAGKIAGIVLAVLRCDQRPGDLAGGNQIHRTTVTRWVREVVGLPAARA